MKKKTIGLLITGLLIIIGITIYFTNFHQGGIQAYPYRAIPKNAIFIFEFNNIHQIINKAKSKKYWDDLQKIDFTSMIEQRVSILDSLFVNDPELHLYLDRKKLIASLHLIQSGKYDYLFIIETDELSSSKLRKLLTVPFEEHIFENTFLFELKTSEKKISITVAYANGLLLCSPSAFLVEDALTQLKSNQQVISDNILKKIKTTVSKNNDLSVFINFDNLHLLASIYGRQNNTESLKNFAQWASLDLVLNDNSILINGYTVTNDSLPNKQYLYRYNQNTPQENELINLLPSNATLMIYNSEENLVPSPSLGSVQSNYFLPWIGNERAFVISEPFDLDFTEYTFAVIKTNDIKLAEVRLLQLSKESPEGFKEEVYKNNIIRKIQDEQSFSILFGDIYSCIKNPYYTLLQNYVVFANSMKQMRSILEKYIDGQTLKIDEDYLRFSENLSSTSNCYTYLNLSRSLQILSALAPPSFSSDLKNNFSIYRKFSPLGIQFTYFKDMFYTTGYINYNSSNTDQKGFLWKTKLDTPASIQPYLTINHTTKENEIIIQDLNNNLYLLSKGGQILWKKNLDGKILSKIYQVDFFKNNKLQFLFNTKKRVYLIDRNGIIVESFSIALSSKATTGMTMVDFDNNKNYRYFIPCENGNVYGYELSGKPLVGWNPKNNIGIMNDPIQYFSIAKMIENKPSSKTVSTKNFPTPKPEEKDFLVAVNNMGTVYFLNKQGELKAKAELKTQFNNPFTLDPKNNIVSCDINGKIYEISFDGKYTTNPNLPEIKNAFFALADIYGDSLKEYCFVHKNELSAYNESNKLLFTYSLPTKIEQQFFIVASDEHNRVGIICDSTQQLFLFDRDGNPEDGFPLNGSTPFELVDLFKDKGKIVIAASENGIVAYRQK